MQTSTDRILTTHVGSMPRPEELTEILYKIEFNEPYENNSFIALLESSVSSIVSAQIEWGLDIINDGEMGKTGYSTYIQQRLDGFSGESASIRFDDMSNFPEYRRNQAKAAGTRRLNRPCCTGEIKIRDREPLLRDIYNLKTATSNVTTSDVFMNAASPGVIAVFQENKFYSSNTEYLQKLADTMKEEYEAIVESGFILQIDCPDLAMGRHTVFRDLSDHDFILQAAKQIEILNNALQNIPAERVRMHICWGNYEGPHTFDIGLEKILPIIIKSKVKYLLIESSNPRHAHEWKVFENIKVPQDKVIVPGVIDSTSNFVEHPELIVDRLKQFSSVIPKDQLMAGTDCGFSTFAGFGKIDEEICYQKLSSLVEGASLASKLI